MTRVLKDIGLFSMVIFVIGMVLMPPIFANTADSEKHLETYGDNVQPLASHAWSKRPFILFAPKPKSNGIEKQIERLERHQKGIRDRDIAVYKVFKGGGTGPSGKLTDAQIQALRDRFGVASDEEAVILVGKDTTEKMRKTPPICIQDVFELIDQMPMRKREMNE